MENSSKNNSIDPLFWLPSDFLSDNNDDDEIVMGQDNLNLTSKSNTQLPTEFHFDFTELTRLSASQNKWALSGSPQSILSPVLSNGSPNGPLSPTAPFGDAAGEVNMSKMRNQTINKNRALPPNTITHVKQKNGSVWGPPCRVSHEFGSGLTENARTGRAQRPLLSGWPMSLVQKQHFNVNGYLVFSGGLRYVGGGGLDLKKKCAGTGVFLPRTCPDPLKPGCPPSFTPYRPAQALNVKCNHYVMTQAQAQAQARLTIGGVTIHHDALLLRNEVLVQQWHKEMYMMGKRAMNC